METPSSIVAVLKRINELGIDTLYWGIVSFETEIGFFSTKHRGEDTIIPPCLYITNNAMADFAKWFPVPDVRVDDEDCLIYYIYYL